MFDIRCTLEVPTTWTEEQLHSFLEPYGFQVMEGCPVFPVINTTIYQISGPKSAYSKFKEMADTTEDVTVHKGAEEISFKLEVPRGTSRSSLTSFLSQHQFRLPDKEPVSYEAGRMLVYEIIGPEDANSLEEAIQKKEGFELLPNAVKDLLD